MPDTPDIEIPVRDGITEGGLIIIGLISLGVLFLWFFGRVLARKLDQTLQEVKSNRAEVAVVKSEVKNSHTTPLREDLDEKDSRSHEKLDKLLSRMDGIDERLSGIDARMTGQDIRLGRIEKKL